MILPVRPETMHCAFKKNHPLSRIRRGEVDMIGAFELPEVEDDDDMDIYAALGLNTPVGDDAVLDNSVAVQDLHDPLAAFMDDDEEEGLTYGQLETATVPVEELLATLARGLFDDELLQKVLPNLTADMNSMRVHKDRDAYHLSLIIDMGGEHIKPFATVIAVEDEWKPMNPPKGLHARWKPIYDSLCKALTDALSQQGQPSSL